jgi:membrane-associated protein
MAPGDEPAVRDRTFLAGRSDRRCTLQVGAGPNMGDFFNTLRNPEALKALIDQYENWSYLILFAVVFCETGLVIMPLLPGDTLLFAAGVCAASTFHNGTEKVFNIAIVMPLLTVAAILGDTVNYWIGRAVGPTVFRKDHARFLDKENLQRAHRFYEKSGGRTIFVGRFIPLIRCFVPFVAGVGTMPYPRFLLYSVLGTITWMSTFVLGGYFLGRLPIVQKYFGVVCLSLSAIGFVVIVSTILRQIRKGMVARSTAGEA